MSEERATPWFLRLLICWPTFAGAVFIEEWGSDLRLPWWFLLMLVAGAAATGGRRMAATLRQPEAWPWLLALTAVGFGACFLGASFTDEGMAAVHRPWRWCFAIFVCALWCEGWAQDPAAAPGWVHRLARPHKE